MAGIIKRPNPLKALETGLGEAQPFRFPDIDETRETILRRAREEADTLLEAARREADSIRHEAAELGRDDGPGHAREQAGAELRDQLADSLPLIRKVADSLAAERSQWENQWTVSVIDLAVRIAEKIIRHELRQRPAITATLVREALDAATNWESLRLRLHPEDAELINREMPSLLKELRTLAPAEIVSDPAISRGSCLLESRHGQIDQRIETQLARINAELCGTM